MSAWHLQRDVILAFQWPLIAAFVSQLALFATWLGIFGRMPCCHGYSAKVWGLAMLVAVVALFGFNYKPLLWAAIICCIVNAVDEMIIALTLLEWDHDVKSVVHALRLRKALAEGAVGIARGVLRRMYKAYNSTDWPTMLPEANAIMNNRKTPHSHT